jgi:hypothetical protein
MFEAQAGAVGCCEAQRKPEGRSLGVSQCNHRIDLRRATRRDDRCNHRHRYEKRRDDQQHDRIAWTRVDQEAVKQLTGAPITRAVQAVSGPRSWPISGACSSHGSATVRRVVLRTVRHIRPEHHADKIAGDNAVE